MDPWVMGMVSIIIPNMNQIHHMVRKIWAFKMLTINKILSLWPWPWAHRHGRVYCWIKPLTCIYHQTKYEVNPLYGLENMSSWKLQHLWPWPCGQGRGYVWIKLYTCNYHPTKYEANPFYGLENMSSKHTLNLKFQCVWPWGMGKGITDITLNLYLSSYQI